MAINRNDDYEKLAKLLYPSIEASGNTYYGQTRKLTLDEVFNKNNGGFESHLESIRVPDTSSESGFKYDVVFKWKVGPLSGSLDADVQYNSDTWFAVYEIVQDPITNVNQLNSGEFNSYEYNTHAAFTQVISTDGKSPINLEDDYDGRNFYVNKDGIKNYIYVLLHGRFIENEPSDSNIEGIKLTAKNGPVTIGLNAVGQIDSANYASFKYKLQNDTAWNSLNLFADGISGTLISLQANEYVLIKRLPNKIKDYNSDRYVQFTFDRPSGSNGTIDVSGNMLYMAKDQSSYSAQLDIFEFASLFRGCTLLTSAPKLPFTNLNIGCYYNMFRGCSSLELPPELPATVLTEACYWSMFRSCTSLKRTPILTANSLVDGCYMQMFQGCSNLNYAECYAKVNNGNTQTTYWMDSVSNAGTFVTCTNTVLSEDSNGGIPVGWNHITQDLPINPPINADNITVLKTNGCDYFGNGRGDVSDPNTLFNMESSFDENGTHQMNTYNIDGSLNQEVWGYKCFNSPVQFKNGIYGEQAKLVTTHETKDTNGNNSFVFHDTWDGSKLSADKASVSVLKTKNVSTSGTITQYDLSGSSTYISAGDIAYSSVGNVYTGDADNSTYGSICATTYHTGTAGSNIWTVSDVVLKSCLDNDCYSIINLSSNKNEPTDNTATNNSKIKLGSYSSNNSSYINIMPTEIDIHGDILPTSDGTYDLGTDIKKWEYIYCKYIHAEHVNVSNLNSDGYSTLYYNKLVFTDSNSDPLGDVSCSGNRSLGINGDFSISMNAGFPEVDEGASLTLRYLNDGGNDIYHTLTFSVDGSEEAQIYYNPDIHEYEFSVDSIATKRLNTSSDFSIRTAQNKKIVIGTGEISSGFSALSLNNSPTGALLQTNQGSIIIDSTSFIQIKSGYAKQIKLTPGVGADVSVNGDLTVSNTLNVINLKHDSASAISAGNLYCKSEFDGESNGNLILSKLSGTQESLYIAEAATHAKINSSDDSKTDCPIGSIVYAILSQNIKPSGTVVKAGEPFEVSNGQALVVKLTSSGWASTVAHEGLYLPEGKYKAFNAIEFTGNPAPFSIPVLIQRVANDPT